MTRMETTESPNRPLERTAHGITIAFDTATVTLEGVLPAGFSGPVAKAAQDLFRPLEVVIDPGQYSILLSGRRYRAGETPQILRVKETSALTVGGFVCAWLENLTTVPQPFRLRLRGHSGRAHRGGPASGEEVGCSSVVLGMIASEAKIDRAKWAEPESRASDSTALQETEAIELDEVLTFLDEDFRREEAHAAVDVHHHCPRCGWIWFGPVYTCQSAALDASTKKMTPP